MEGTREGFVVNKNGVFAGTKGSLSAGWGKRQNRATESYPHTLPLLSVQNQQIDLTAPYTRSATARTRRQYTSLPLSSNIDGVIHCVASTTKVLLSIFDQLERLEAVSVP